MCPYKNVFFHIHLMYRILLHNNYFQQHWLCGVLTYSIEHVEEIVRFDARNVFGLKVSFSLVYAASSINLYFED